MRLNLGAGQTRIEGFTNVDHEKFPETDIVSKIDNLGFALKDSIEEIYASNVLEHCTFSEAEKILVEWCRVLKRGGKIYISVPDMMAINEYVNRNGWDRWIAGIVYAGTSTYKDLHNSGYDFAMLSEYMEQAGFKNVYKVEKFPFDLVDCSQCKARDFIDNKSYLIVLNVIAEKA